MDANDSKGKAVVAYEHAATAFSHPGMAVNAKSEIEFLGYDLP